MARTLPNALIPSPVSPGSRSLSGALHLARYGIVRLLHGPLAAALWLLVLQFAPGPLSGATQLQLGESSGEAGESFLVPLRLFTDEEVVAVQLDLVADPAVVTVAGVSAGEATADHAVDSHDRGNGETRVVVYSTNNRALSTEVLIHIQVQLAAAVPPNTRAFELSGINLADGSAIEVLPDLIPVARALDPLEGRTYRLGDEIVLEARATDTDGSISRVDFFSNGRPIGSSQAAPFTVNWKVEDFSRATIEVVAVDNAQHSFRSAPVIYPTRYATSLQDWLAVYFDAGERADPAVGGPLADFDSDGHLALLEYALGDHPRRSGPAVGLSVNHDLATGRTFISYAQPADLADVEVLLEFSTDFTNWSGLPDGIDALPVTESEGFEQFRFEVVDPDLTRQHIRLRVEETDGS